MSVGQEHVLESVRVLRAALEPHLHRDWSVCAGDPRVELHWRPSYTRPTSGMPWSCRRRAATGYLRCSRGAKGSPQKEGLAAHDAVASLLVAVMRGTPPQARGYHGQSTDAEGFAAMHCDEVLIHGYDIAMGLGVAFSPPLDLARRVRDRLFPWTVVWRPMDDAFVVQRPRCLTWPPSAHRLVVASGAAQRVGRRPPATRDSTVPAGVALLMGQR